MTLGILLAAMGAPVWAAPLYYNHGSPLGPPKFFPQSGGTWDSKAPSWWSYGSGGLTGFAPGDEANFKQDGNDPVSLTLAETVSALHLRVERGDFTIEATDGAILSALPGGPRSFRIAPNASLAFSGLLDGEFDMSVGGHLALTTAGAGIRELMIDPTGRVELGSGDFGGQILIAGDVVNGGRLTIAAGADVAAGGATSVTGAGARLTVEGRLASDVGTDTGSVTVIAEDGTIAGDVKNDAQLILRGGLIEGTLINGKQVDLEASSAVDGDVVNSGVIASVGGDHMLAISGSFLGDVGGVVSGSADARLTIEAQEFRLDHGLQVGDHVWLSARDSVTNNGALTIAADAGVKAQQILHQGGHLTSAGTLTAQKILLGADATLSGRISGAVELSGGTTTVVDTLDMADPLAVAGAPHLRITGGEFRLDPAAHLTVPLVENDGLLSLGDGSVVRGDVVNRYRLAFADTGTIDGDLTMAGTAQIVPSGTLTITGRLINEMAAAQFLSGFASLNPAGIENRGMLTIDEDLASDLVNSAGGDLTILHDMSGAVTSAGTTRIGPAVGASDVSLTGGLAVTGGVTTTGGTVDLSGPGVPLSVDGPGTLAVADGRLTVAGDIDSRGTLTVAAGATLAGDRLNLQGGTADVAGRIEGETLVGAGATLRLTDGVIDGALTNSGTAVLNDAGIAGEVRNLAGGDLTVSGGSMGDLMNGGVAAVETAIAGSVQNAGTLSLAGSVGGEVRNDSTADLTVTGDLSAGQVANAGRFTVAAGGGLTVDDPALNQAGGVMTVLGRVDGQVQNAAGGQFTLGAAGWLQTLQNSGAASLSGTIGGAVSNTGMIAIDGTLAADITNAAGGRVEMDAGDLLSGGLNNQAGGTLHAAGQIGGDLTNAGTVRMTGALAVGGDVTNNGKITQTTAGNVLTVGGTLVQNGDIDSGGFDELTIRAGSVSLGDATVRDGVRIIGAISVDGDVTFSGDQLLTDGLTIGAGRTARFGGALTASAGVVTVRGDVIAHRGLRTGAGATLDLAGTGRLTGDLANAGTAQLDGRVDGAVTNTGEMRLAGTIAGDLVNDGGTVVTRGNATVTGVLTNASAPFGRMAPDGAMQQQALAAAQPASSTLRIRAGDRLAVGGGVVNNIGGGVTLAGQLSGNVTNAGAISMTGGWLEGSLVTSGRAHLDGGISGNLTYAAGELLVTGDLAVGGTVDLRDDATIGQDRRLSAARIRNRQEQRLTVAGAIVGQMTNEGVLDLQRAGKVEGDVTNSGGGAIRAGDQARIDGTLDNRGTVDLRDGTAGSVLRVGGLSGDGVYALDVWLDEDGSEARADRIEVRGGAVTGNLRLDLNMLSLPVQSPLDRGVLLVDADDAFADRNTYGYSAKNLPPGTEKLVYGLEKTRAGDLLLNYGTNAAIGGISGNVVLTQSLIGSVVNRPTSPFVTGYAPAEGESRCAPGAWTRATGGRADASGASTARTYGVESSISASYRGLQFGGDLACHDGYFNGWNMAFGVIGGVNDGSTSQPVYLLEWDGSAWNQTGQRASINRSEFRQIYGGVYMTASRENVSADLQFRREHTRFTLNNKPLIQGSGGLGLTDARFDSGAWTLSGSLSYAMALRGGWQFVPTAGFSFTNSSTDPVIFDDGARLEIKDSKSRVGFLGATLSRGRVLESGVEAVNYYATGTVYKDFAGGTRSEFIKYRPDGSVELSEQLVSDNLGVYGEIGIGAAYTRVLQSGRAGRPKQFSASVRVDGRTGSSLDSMGVTAQMRWQF